MIGWPVWYAHSIGQLSFSHGCRGTEMKLSNFVAASTVCSVTYVLGSRYSMNKLDNMELEGSEFSKNSDQVQHNPNNLAIGFADLSTIDFLLGYLPREVREKIKQKMLGSDVELRKKFSEVNAMHHVIHVVDEEHYDELDRDFSKLEDMSFFARESSIRKGFEGIITARKSKSRMRVFSWMMLVTLENYNGLLGPAIYERIKRKGLTVHASMGGILALIDEYLYPSMDHKGLAKNILERIDPKIDVDLNKDLPEAPKAFAEFVGILYRIASAHCQKDQVTRRSDQCRWLLTHYP